MIKHNQNLLVSEKSIQNDKKDILNEKKDILSILDIEKRQFGYFTAITLPLILAACGGGGGGGGNVSPTPAPPSTDDGSTDSGSTDSGIEGTDANAGNYTASSAADNYIYDVSFASDGAVTKTSDGNVIISNFDAANDTITLRGLGAPASFSSEGSNVDIASDINGNTIITLGNDNNASDTAPIARGLIVNFLPDSEYLGVMVVRPVGVEPTTYGLEVRCSIQLSYRRKYKSKTKVK